MVTHQPPSRSLFHYTTAQGLVGILSSQSLFATHADFLNDSSECRLLKGVLEPTLISEFRDIAPKLVSANLMTAAAVAEFGERAFEEFASGIVDTMLRTIEKISPIYITSFCLHGAGTPEYQNGLLSQWRAYANGGFAIEFDEDGLDKLTNIETSAFRYECILTEQVSYKDHAGRAGLDRFHGIVAAALKVHFADKGKNADDILGERQLLDFLRPFVAALPFLKAPGFREEREYRMVSLAYRRGISAELNKRPLRDIQFRSGANGSVAPYIAVFDKSDLKLPVKSVLIGPHPNQDNQETAIKLLLDQYDIKAEVRRSKLTLRS